jgi:hypothetical protein
MNRPMQRPMPVSLYAAALYADLPTLIEEQSSRQIVPNYLALLAKLLPAHLW